MLVSVLKGRAQPRSSAPPDHPAAHRLTSTAQDRTRRLEIRPRIKKPAKGSWTAPSCSLLYGTASPAAISVPADVVAYAYNTGKTVDIVWPSSAQRP